MENDFDEEWFDVYHFDKNKISKYTWTLFDEEWFDREWYDKEWFDRSWYDEEWFDRTGKNEDWFSKNQKKERTRQRFIDILEDHKKSIESDWRRLEYLKENSKLLDVPNHNYAKFYNNPYFLYSHVLWTDKFIGNYYIDPEKKREIIKYTSEESGKIRYIEWYWELKKNILIENWSLIDLNDYSEIIDTDISMKSQEKWKTFFKKDEPLLKTWIKDISMKLREEQDEIMRAPIAWVCLITWSAWSWKTNILIHRIDYLLSEYKQSFTESNIAFFCYNVSLKKYLSEILNEKFPNVNVFSIDSRQLKIAREYLQIKQIDYKKIDNWLFSLKNKLNEKLSVINRKNFLVNKIVKNNLSIGLDANKIFEFCFDSKQNKYSINEMFLMLYFLSNISIKDLRKEKFLIDSEKIIRYNIVLSFNDIDYKYTYESTKHILSFDIHKPKHDHILVDEVQDLQPIQIQILNGFHKNSMTIAWDPTQLLQNSKVSDLASFFWIKINSSYKLLLSHRISYETAIFANNIIKDKENIITIDKVPFHSAKPIINGFSTLEDCLNKTILNIKEINKNDPEWNICIVRPKLDFLDKIVNFFVKNWINTYKAYRYSRDFWKKIHTTTYHQIKWLEFDYVFILWIEDLDKWVLDNKENIFYTVATRARKRLFISYIWNMPEILKKISHSQYESSNN